MLQTPIGIATPGVLQPKVLLRLHVWQQQRMQRLRCCWTMQWQNAHGVANGALATFACVATQCIATHNDSRKRIMSQRLEVVATCAIATPTIWLLYGAVTIATQNDCGKKDYVVTPRSGGNMCNCHAQHLVAIRCSRYCCA